MPQKVIYFGIGRKKAIIPFHCSGPNTYVDFNLYLYYIVLTHRFQVRSTH